MINYKLMFACSKDGFIAKKQGDNPQLWTSKEDKELLKNNLEKIDWTIMGRVTHELNPNIDRKRIVFTRKVQEPQIINPEIKNQIYFNPDINQISDLENIIGKNSNVLILGGTRVHDFFLYIDVISEIEITLEPLVFEKGLPAFSFINFKDLEDLLISRNYKKREKYLNESTILINYSR
tara:strand:- start:1032 stop:1568 length:537 start_codon:yes stop_codon:yes gene_type:complete